VSTLVKLIDRISDLCGRALAWLMLAMMLTTCLVVIMRYVFGAGNIIFFQELVIYFHATAFMLGASWTLKRQGHVRVDVFYRNFSPHTKAWVDSLGSLVFLMPVGFFLLISSEDFIWQSWRVKEISREAGGIGAVYLLKTLIPLMAILLLLQGFAEVLRNAMVLIKVDDKRG
jgi:TRAP-type mannitol/chloroaromatic compound transport system permease small subunit